MQQLWYSIKKLQGIDSYEFLLANKKCNVNAEVFRTILDICLRVEGIYFTDVLDDDTALTFHIGLGCKGPLYKQTNMFVDHIHQPWRTLADMINKCLSGKTASNDKLKKSRIDILWGMLKRENVDYPELIWEDISYQIDHMKEKRSRRKNMPYPRLTKIIINHFLKQHKSFTNLNYQHYHTIKDDGIVSRIISDVHQVFNRLNSSQEEKRKKTSSKRRVKKKVTLSANDNIISNDLDAALKLAKSISKTKVIEAKAARQVHATHARIVIESVPESAKKKSGCRISKSVAIQDTSSAPKSKPATSKTKLKGALSFTPKEQEAADIIQALKESKKTSKRQLGTGGSNEGTSSKPGVLDESTIIFATSSERTGIKLGVPDEEKDITEEKDDIYGDADDKGDDHISDIQDAMMKMSKMNPMRMISISDEEVTDAAKVDAEKTSEVKDDAKKTELPPSSSSLSVSSGFGDQFLKLSFDFSLISTVKDTTDSEINSLLEVKIQSEVPHTQYSSMLSVPVFVNFEPTKIDLSAEALATLKTHVSFIVDNYLGSKVVDVFQKELKKHTTDLIQKYSLQQFSESSKKQTLTVDLEQEFEKRASEILKIKREQAEMQQMPEFTIKSTDKADDTVTDHKRTYDDDEDDEDPQGGPNQVRRPRGKELKSLSLPRSHPSPRKSQTVKHQLKALRLVSLLLQRNQLKNLLPRWLWMKQVMMWFMMKINHKMLINPRLLGLQSRLVQATSKAHTPDPEWNKCQIVLDQSEQPCFNQMVNATKDPLTFNDLMATPIDFSKYVMNRLKIENLTQDILLGHAFSLLKGTCSINIELEYNFQECFNALTDKLEWNNPKGDRYLFDLSKPLPLQGPPCHRTVVVDYLFNNDLEYLKTSDLEVTYTTSITKIKVSQYEIKEIENMVPTLLSTIKHMYDKDAKKEIKHWGERCKLWYRSQVSKFSKQNVYSTKAILGVKSVSVKKLHGYGHLEEIVVQKSDQRIYKFKEGDFVDLHLNDIEDMLLVVVQHKLFHLDRSNIVDFIVALRMFTRSLILKRRVKDLELDVESYQKLNITKPQKTFPEIKFKKTYTPSYDPPRIVYEDMNKQKRVLRADELYKFSGWHTQVCSR
uniref:Uncharacterized protein n=1 Tax=Tanacetum cinerariifolium TaxID=118510 RepID=A0A6L2LP33_TANCI|nr:hypothetical protein [Tanacetum cinerariifolium]